MANFDQFQLAVEGNGNNVLYDDKGLPSVMVPIPKFNLKEVNDAWPDTPHPAFLINDKVVPVIYISKYQNVVEGDRAYSLPMREPKHTIDFDTAKAACEAKGRGWHMMTNAEWAAIALWCRKNQCMPRGNNDYGKDITSPNEKGIPSATDSEGRTTRVYAGSGPDTWSHNSMSSGIWDMNGNVWEWVSGYRTVDGEIQITPQNNSALGLDEKLNSKQWKAILQNGNLVAPGTVGTLKWDYTDPVPAGGETSYPFVLSTQSKNVADNDVAYGSVAFQELTIRNGVTVPDVLKHLAIYPVDKMDNGGGYFYMRNIGERFAFRGGAWGFKIRAGVFSLNGGFLRSQAGSSSSFRSAYVDLDSIS